MEKIAPGKLHRTLLIKSKIKIDEFVRSLKIRFSVIPANPGSGPGQAPESGSFK
jgi:hypothetical protein